MSFHKLYWEALDDKDDPVMALRQVMIDLRAQGVEKDILINELEDFSKLAAERSETDEDIVFDVLDFLVGFCSPHMRID